MKRAITLLTLMLLAGCGDVPQPHICREKTSPACRFVIYMKDGTLYRYEEPTTPINCISRARAYEALLGEIFKGMCIEEELGS